MLATERHFWYTVSQMKQAISDTVKTATRETENVSDFIWETFDGLFKTVNRQDKRVNDLEARVVELERRLSERTINAVPQSQQGAQSLNIINELPAERAA